MKKLKISAAVLAFVLTAVSTMAFNRSQFKAPTCSSLPASSGQQTLDVDEATECGGGTSFCCYIFGTDTAINTKLP